MKRKYLDDLGITNRPDLWNQTDERQKNWTKEREEYGFDERDTWSMSLTFECWLYEHLMMYKESANINFDFHKFEYKGKTYTQGEMINKMIELLETSLKSSNSSLDEVDTIREIAQMWAVVLPAMWW